MFVEGGKIKLIIGPMFSGKSTMLTDTVRKFVYKGMKTVLVNFAADKRYDKEGNIGRSQTMKNKRINLNFGGKLINDKRNSKKLVTVIKDVNENNNIKKKK